MSTLLSHNANLSPCHTEVSIPNLQSRNMVAPGGGSFQIVHFHPNKILYCYFKYDFP